MSEKTPLVFATHNAHKAFEIQAILGEAFNVKTLSDIGFFDEIEETENTLEGNARLKSDALFSKFNCNVFSDDTGLEVTALNGEPGVFSARYAGEEKDNQANMALLLKNLQPFADRSAQFRTVISLYFNGQHHFFEGVVKGTIITKKRGNAGFGYDPIFVPDGHSKTFAEMDKTEKNAISHRGRAIAKMVAFLTGKG
ncbi:MAG: RdgB/HAM1 family non-canonical purine NTP pyrophosphatase [Flavobacteriales bacterium]|nr:RdgB/HAM1 family non-canonical purine NTP pyrophosphatase [Flavobacteriales bacterium]